MGNYQILIKTDGTAAPPRLPPSGSCRPGDTVTFSTQSGTATVTFTNSSPFAENPVSAPSGALPITANPPTPTSYPYQISFLAMGAKAPSDSPPIIIVDGGGVPGGKPKRAGRKPGVGKKPASTKAKGKTSGKATSKRLTSSAAKKKGSKGKAKKASSRKK